MTAAADPAGAAVLATYREPSQLVRDKVVDSLDRHCRAFIALSPFATLATAGPDGWPDVSPRGGDPGFARVLDERTVVLPDRQGNNRADSLRNAVVNPRAALLFFVPGFEETLKVFGTTTLVGPDDLGLDLTEFVRPPRQDNSRASGLRNAVFNPRAALLFFVPGFGEPLKVFGPTTLVGPDALGLNLTECGRPPRSVLVLTVERAYFQCGKAVMRSGLGDPQRRVVRSPFPSLGEVLRDHCGLSTPLPGQEEMRAELAREL